MDLSHMSSANSTERSYFIGLRPMNVRNIRTRKGANFCTPKGCELDLRRAKKQEA
jgi:hypothetical protein